MSSFDSSFNPDIRLPRVYEYSPILLYPPRYRYMAGITILIPGGQVKGSWYHYWSCVLMPCIQLYYTGRTLDQTMLLGQTQSAWWYMSGWHNIWRLQVRFPVQLSRRPSATTIHCFNQVEHNQQFCFFMASGQQTPTSQLDVHVADWFLTAYPFDSN